MSAVSVCTTPACVTAANAMIGYMAANYTKLDPCANWDNYACQGFRDTHTGRPDQVGSGVFDLMQDNVTTFLHAVLDGDYPGASDHSSFSPRNLVAKRASVDQDNFNMMKSFYNSCMNQTELKRVGVAPVVSLLNDFIKVFPVDDAAYASGPNVTAADTKVISDSILWMEKLGVETLASLGVGVDDKDPNANILFVTPPSDLGLPSNDNYEEPQVVDLYHSLLTMVLNATLPSVVGRRSASKLAEGIIQLESRIAKAIPPLEDQREPTKYYTPMSLDATSALAPVLDLKSVLMGLAPKNYSINYMVTSFPAYYTNVSAILATTPRATVQAWFIYNLVYATRNLVIAPEVEPIRRFLRILNGQDPNATTDRWRTCLSMTSSNLQWIVGRFFVEKAFSEKAKNLGDQIIKDLRAEFVKKFNTSDWMDDATRAKAIEKVNQLNPKIGYPTKSPNVMDPESLQAWYSGLTIDSSLFDNGIATSKWSSARSWSKLGQPVDKDDWGMSPQTINAYYNPSGNEIVFPAAIMQFPLFDADTPDYMSYGGFGSVVGHEMSHGFDMMGRQYDGQGYLRDWWTNATDAAFEERAQCFVQEYANFSVTASDGTVQHGNGELDLGENIADSGGVEIAYGAWKVRDTAAPGQKLPGLENFTNDQSFFLWRSPFFCSGYTTEYLISLMQTDPHPPDSYRTTAPSLNSKEFRQSFDCASKVPTCQLW